MVFRDSENVSREARQFKRVTRLAGGVVALILGLIGCTQMFEYVSASEIVGISYPNGSLKWYTSQGPVLQFFGRVFTYPKRGQLKFTAEKDEKGAYKTDGDGRIKIGFNEGGEAKILGSLNYEMPLAPDDLTRLHAAYPTQEALESGLLRPALNQTIFLTGQLMSSHESYRDRRTQIVQFVEDQVLNGIYQTRSKTETIVDPTTKEERQVRGLEIITAPNGQPQRAVRGEVGQFKVRTYNFAIEDIDYSDTVDKQIQAQQGITMAVETAIAKAKEAQQNEITAGAQGRAVAEQTKQEQEAINAKIVSEADGRRRAAEQDKLAAAAEREARILRAQGESEARRLLMAADNALERKLTTIEKINETWAAAFAKYPGQLVPSVVMGGAEGNRNGVAATQEFMNLLTAKAALDMGVSLSPRKD